MAAVSSCQAQSKRMRSKCKGIPEYAALGTASRHEVEKGEVEKGTFYFYLTLVVLVR